MARRVCQAFGFLDPRGEPRTASCLMELRRLERVAGIELVAARPGPGYWPSRGLEVPVPAPVEVKAIWIKPLMRHWRRELGVDQPIVPNTGGDAGDWAERLWATDA